MTPPRLALSKLMERELETSFTRTDLKYVQERLPKLLIEDMEIAENVEVETEEKGTLNVTISKHIFQTLINDTPELQKTYRTMGSPLSSAIACALAKATGKPITIEKEERNREKTTIQYRIMEE